MKRLFLILFALVSIAVPIFGIAAEIGIPSSVAPFCVAGVLVSFALAFRKQKNATQFTPFVKNGVEVEMWSDFIASNLFKGYEFVLRSFDASRYVLQGKVVHIPQAGGAPTVVRNRTSLPAVAVKRTDTDVTYAIDEFTTDPVIIEDAANVQLSYDKMNDVMGDHTGILNETVCDDLLYKWAPAAAARITRSTGTSAAGNTYLPSATGTRKAYTLKDLKNIQTLMNKNKVPKDGRVAVMTEDAWAQIEEDLRVSNSRDFSRYNDAAEGTLSNKSRPGSIGRLYGFDLYTTPTVVVYDNTATPVLKAFGALGAATDNDAILCWQERMVERAVGEIKFFGQEQAPLYYGDVYSGLVRCGGRKRYSNETGVYAIVQGV